MASSVQVLCPNGRRQTVKISPATTLLQAIEEVCKKQNFMPPEDYNLVHQRKVLDLTLPFRYANLPNNAKLELVKATQPRAVSDVMIGLQLEGGQRLQHQFPPSTSLWNILSYWEGQKSSGQADQLCMVDSSVHPPRHPICVYMGEEIIGEFALRETSLKTLGLTGGKAIIRLVHRAVDDLTIAKSIQDIEKEKEKQARLRAMAEKQETPKESQNPTTCVMPGAASELTSQEVKMDVDAASNISEAMDTGDPREGPSGVDKRQSQTEETAPKRKAGADAAGASNTLSTLENIPGVQVFRPSDFYDLSPQEQAIARRLAQTLMPRLGLTAASSNTQPSSSQSQSFQNFKFPEATKGKALYQNELSEVNREEFQPCDRETVVFNCDERQTSADKTEEDIPDDFFEVTEADVKNMLADYQKDLENMMDQPLLTQAMRRNQAIQRMSKYQRAVIRVQFPDRMVLQAVFRPRETVFAVQKFVKEHLEDKSIPFTLYTSPPKQVLKDNTKNLLEAQLVPATVVYFSSEVKRDHYLSRAVLREVSSVAAADGIVARSLPLSPSDTNMGPSTSAQSTTGKDTTEKPTTSSQQSTEGSSKGKVPKWFKKGKQ